MDLYEIAVLCFLLISPVSTFREAVIHNKTEISVAGATINLSCPVSCPGKPPEWSFGGVILAEGFNINPNTIQKGRLRVNHICGQSTAYLVISNITEIDKGLYCCENLAPRVVMHCTMLELTELAIETDENNTLNVVEDEHFSLACFLTKAVQGVYLKIMNNHSVVASSASAKLNVTLKAAKELNRQTFICAAIFNVIDISLDTKVILNIIYKPSVKIHILPSSSLLVGDNASFICSYNSDQNPVSILWQKNGSTVSTNETFTINNITIADAGNYKCTVNNGKFSREDNVKIFVLYGQVIQLKNNSLICNSTDFSANYTFSNWEHQTTAGKHIRFLTQKSNEMIHFINNESIPTYKINGRYLCKVENVSIAYKDVSLSGKPICLGDKEPSGQLGKNVIITRKVYSSNISKFNWRKGDLQLTNNSKFTIFSNENSAMVEMYQKYLEIKTTTIGIEIKQLTEDDFNIQYALTIYSTDGNCTCIFILHTSETFHHKELLFYVVTTFICTVVILSATAIYTKTRKGFHGQK